MDIKDTTNEIRKGLLVLAVLNVVGRNKCYAAEILKTLSSTEFKTQEGTLYPLLSRLRREGLIDHEWIESTSGPPRKYFFVSEDGKKYATKLYNYLSKISAQITKLGGEI